MRTILAVTLGMLMVATMAGAQLAEKIVNTSGTYLVWGDYKIEVNQYGGLGRNWPTPDLVWEQYEFLKKRAEANADLAVLGRADPPNVIRTLLLVFPTTEATAVKEENGEEVVVGTKTTSLTSAELKWHLEQWREFEEMVFVYSGGNAWVRTDIKIINEPLKVRTTEGWGFWGGQKRDMIDKYVPFERGDYMSYNSLYCSKGLHAGPHGGTIGAIGGIKGCGTSDNAIYCGGRRIDERTGYVALHEWLNQQASATSNMMPYPDHEALWTNYVLHKVGYREDSEVNPWPWISMRRDTMTQIIRPGMWKRWTAIDPYRSLAIGEWLMFGPLDEGLAREISTTPDSKGNLLTMTMEKYTQFDITEAEAAEKPVIAEGTYYFRTYVASDKEQEVRLWAAADDRFQLWLNGVMIRDGWGWNYSDDDGKLFEKVTYATLEAGVNTLVLVVPNREVPKGRPGTWPTSKDLVEFRVRFCKTDGSGQQPEGVTCPVAGVAGNIVPLRDPVVYDFTDPTFFTWADINDMPWTKLPRLGEAELRTLTGIDTLSIKTVGAPYTNKQGQTYDPPQHLFLDVPEDAVASPWMAAPAEDNAKLNNDLDYNWKSMAWLRVPGRPGADKDIVFLRFDVAEALMNLLKTKGRPANESIVGWVLLQHKLAYVVLVDLDGSPTRELEALSKQPE